MDSQGQHVEGEVDGLITVVLDLRVTEDGFIQNEAATQLIAALERLGKASCLVRSVQPKSGASEWIEGVLEQIPREHVETVVMCRVWNRDVVDALREGWPNARLVRVSQAVRTAYDELFDCCLEPDVIMRAFETGDFPADSRWSKLTARQLRGRADKVAQVSEDQDLVGAAPPNVFGSPPVIYGPAQGCPFLRDALKVHHFASLDLDPSVIQTRGCTFCLDNIGAYAGYSEADTVRVWLKQLQAVREGNPGATQILLGDERPHPVLPAFFRALNAQDDLAPVELLIKSRVDWLLEFAETALSEAVTLAQQGGHTLNIYLVGFENFHQDTLDLFNKGVTVADNLAAIDKMRELAERFPKGLEVFQPKAHGIVLFTPWTTPEHLIENARVMRRVRFHDFREGALDTRLRLYPRVPLYEKARHDGLLVDEFAVGRGDRAQEQGYDASFAWRFADPRTEVVFRLIQDKSVRRRLEANHIGEADVLEIAANFALRYPELGEAPHTAPTFFHHIVHEHWVRMCFEASPEAMAQIVCFDSEIERLRMGERDGCLKEGVPAAWLPDLIEAYRALGLPAALVETHGGGFEAGAGEITQGSDYGLLAIAQSDELLAQLSEAQRGIMRGGKARTAAIRLVSRMLGYPDCCTDAFLEIRDHSDNQQLELLPFRRAPEAALRPEVNRFLYSHAFVSHLMCLPDCEQTAGIANRMLRRLGETSAEGEDWLRQQLGRSFLFLGFNELVLLDGEWDDAGFRVRGVRGENNPDHELRFRSTTHIRVEPTALILVEANGSEERFPARNPLLCTPGEPLAPQALAAIIEAESPIASPPPSRPRPQHSDPLDDRVVAKPDRFEVLYLGSEAALPVPVGRGWRLIETRGAGASIELVLEGGDGERLVAFVRPNSPGSRGFARTRYLTTAYYAPDDDLPGPLIDALMTALTRLLRGREAELERAEFATAWEVL